jgi:hypothetical protein
VVERFVVPLPCACSFSSIAFWYIIIVDESYDQYYGEFLWACICRRFEQRGRLLGRQPLLAVSSVHASCEHGGSTGRLYWCWRLLRSTTNVISPPPASTPAAAGHQAKAVAAAESVTAVGPLPLVEVGPYQLLAPPTSNSSSL